MNLNKKRAISAVILLLAVSILAVCPGAYLSRAKTVSAANEVAGDANSDNVFNIQDLIRIKRYVSNPAGITINMTAGDIDKSGKIDVGDIICCRKLLVGIETTKIIVETTSYVLSDNPILDIDTLSLDDTIERAYLKGSPQLLTLENNQVTVSRLSKGVDTTLILQSETKNYEINVVLVDKLISTAAEVQSIITNGLSNSYVVLTQDIDMGGIQLAGPVWTGTAGLTIDGRGHGIKNFKTQNMFGLDFQQMTFKNLVLDFKSIPWDEKYSGMFGNGGAQSVTMENVYLKVLFERAAFSRGLFASRPSGMNLKNVVVDVTLYGTGSGTVYADYNNVAGAGGDMTEDSTLENVYVICSTKLGKKSDTDTTKYGWDELISGTSVSDIVSIGGSFEKKEDGLYFYNKLVMFPVQRVEKTAYVLSSNPILDIATLSLDDTIERAYLKGSTQLLPLENNQVTINGLLTGADTILILQSATENYEVNVVQTDRLISTADEVQSIITNGLSNSYVVLTQDIDMGGIRLTGPTWTGTSGLTIDGRGHGIKNFTTHNMFGIDFQQMTFKNLVLDFQSIPWAEQYSGMFGNGGAQSVTMENVYLKVAFEKAAFSRGLFASRPSGMNLKNVVVDVSLYGTEAGTVYADYNNFAGAGGDMTADSTLENVYVICATQLSKKSDTDAAKYGWDKLISGTSVSDITSIGGFFEVKTDGLYFNEAKVK